jgi:hypothetical protein
MSRPIPPPWKSTASDLFPELRERFTDADTPYLLWFELLAAFEAAYDEVPPDESMIARIYQFCDWCIEAPGGETAADDLCTCAIVSFLEHVPEHPAAREDMPRWLSYEEVAESETFFAYHLGHAGFEELKRHMRKNQHRFIGRKKRITE